MNKTNTPPITVVISTRNRGGSVAKTIQTILLNDYPHFELRVIDQSEDDTTEASLRPFLNDSRFHYLRSPTKGLSAGRNFGIRHTQSEFIALTDDDCETPKNWLRELVTAFTFDHRIGIVFGNTLPGPHDRTVGFISGYVRNEPFLSQSILEKHRVEGTGACMGLRRSVWQVLGGFDEMLGTGAYFKSAEETDLTIRALLAGYFVYETPHWAVVHQGLYLWEQSRTLIHGYLYGIGAMFAKHLKCRHWSVIQVLLHLAWRWAFEHPVVDFGYRPSRWLRLAAFVQGFAAGTVTPVDRTICHYIYWKK
jgi:glycosyltransferase involved in cell wall biosynthesis